MCSIRNIMAANVAHVQIRFYTKQCRHSIPDTPFSVPGNVKTEDLSSLVNGLLSGDSGDQGTIDFDFLIDGEFLRVPLESYLQQKEISTEDVVEVEYVERQPAPRPEDSLDHDDWVSCVQACDKCILSGCYDNTVRLWSSQGEPLLTIPGHSQPVKCVSWISHSEGEVSSFLSGSHDQTILLWEWNQQTNAADCVHACRGHAASVDCVAVDNTKQRFCSGSWDRMLKLWSAAIDREETDEDEEGDQKPKKRKCSGARVRTRVPLLTLSGHGEGVSAVAWLAEQEVCTASWDHTLRLWDLEKAQQKAVMQSSKVFLGLSFSPLNGLLVTGSADRHVRLWDPRSSEGAIVKCTFSSHSGWVSSVHWSPTQEHLFLSGSYDNLLKLWDKRSPKSPLYNLVGHTDKVLAVDWSEPSLLLSGGADNQLRLFQYHDVVSPDKT